jgi:glucose/arabinose dehydrogenase/PKD repeat protein
MRKAKLACLAAALGVTLTLPSVAPAQEFPSASRFQKVTLNDRPGEPMSLAILPDGRVLHSARTGEIRLHNPRTGLNTMAADMRESPAGLYQHDEEGVQGIALDPNFAQNDWVYVYYSPRQNTPVDQPGTGINEGDAPFNLNTPEDRARLALFKGDIRLSRFKFEDGELDFSTEQEIIDVPVDRGICCHVGGKIDFDGEGNLYLSTGDDTNPFESSGFTPIDERENRNPAFDAQRTSANTNDLRGKILRIRVRANGSYSIPAGNLFRPGTARTKPEIYAMGFRNPFRMSVDKKSNNVYVGDYSPDANAPNPARGPQGIGRWMLVDRPGNYGWPYCMTREIGYVDFDFATSTSGDEFPCPNPVNESPNNTGRRVLPEIVQPDVFYSYPAADFGLFPELLEDRGGNGIGPMGGPAYDFLGSSRSETKWPRVFEGHPLFYEWTRDYFKVFELNRPNGNRLTDIHNLFPGGPSGIVQDNPMDAEFGPDGALYTLEYGDGFFLETPEAQLSRIDFVRQNQYTPIPQVSATPTSATAPPLTVAFSSAGTRDPDGDTLAYAWDFDADGDVDSRQPNASFTYTERGIYDATLRVTDSSGRSASASVRITVGNQAPVVDLNTEPDPGEPFAFGQAVTYTVTVTDDQPVDCARVSVAYILGHDQHGHPQSSTAGCTGTIQTPPLDAGHAGSGNLAAVFVASYTDQPAGETPQTGSDEVRIPPNP